MARAMDKSPQVMYQYYKGKRAPGAEILIQLLQLGANINWVLTGDGPMLLKDINEVQEEAVAYGGLPKGIRNTLKLIDQRLRETEFSNEKKLEILREALNQIAIEQNTHFVQSQINQEE